MSALVRTDDVRRQNTRLIMDILRRQQRISRTDIVRLSGLSPATVSTITSSLLADRVLLSVESDDEEGAEVRRGRPQVTLAMNPAVGCIVVMALSMNTLSACLQDYTGKVLAQTREQFPSRTACRDDFEHYLLRLITRLIGQQPTPALPLRYITLGVQGVVNAEAQTMLWSPVTTEVDLPLGKMLHQAFDVPVWVANDCNMIVEALRWNEPERFRENFAAILLAQGIGMGLMLNGRRFIGRHSSAGEFGHMVYMPNGALCRCGQRGCIEAYAGDYAIVRRVDGVAGDREPLNDVDAVAMAGIIARARTHDGPEWQAYREAGEALGQGLRSLFALIDPVSVAFVGPGAEVFDLMEPSVRKALEHSGKMLESSEIQLYQYPDSEGLIHQGCAITALRALDHSPVVIG